jgi:hypothetical protein
MLQQHLSRLPGADDRTRAAMRDLAHALTARLLHDSIEDLRLGDEGTDS